MKFIGEDELEDFMKPSSSAGFGVQVLAEWQILLFS